MLKLYLLSGYNSKKVNALTSTINHKGDVIMKEIGGYIELDVSRGQEYHNQAVALNSGRHCLEYLIKAKNIKKLYIPYFLCASVKNLCDKVSCEYDFYKINQDLRPVFDGMLTGGEYLYIVNYYGQLMDDDIKEYKKQYGNIIVDNAQAFFEKPLQNVDTLYTCRKFFGVSDGGYLYTDTSLDEEIPIDVSYDRVHYILGRYEEGAAKFYKESSDNNRFFATEKLRYMSKLTHNLLCNIDYAFVEETRRKNFEYLHNELKTINRLNIFVPNGAFMYPLYVENGKELKKHLIDNKIFVPTLWGDVFDMASEGSLEWDFAENIVPIPVDQRYTTEDMQYILHKIKEAL